ncbi:hypothetical protein GCM10023155_38120 [Bremerella cremea]
MATPFKVFRDNQKILMVVFGALLMVAFIILPPVLQYGFQTQTVDNERGNIVVEVDEENLYRVDVDNLRDKYNLVARVMAEAIGQSLILKGSPQPPMPPIPGLAIRPATAQTPSLPEFRPVGAEEAVLYYAWVKKADEIGLVVDDASVREFMRETAGGQLSDYDYNAILMTVTGGERSGITYDHFFEMLRGVLMAQKLQALVFRDGRVVTPGTAWVAYRNLNRSLSTEMFPVSASEFMSKVGEPTSAQITEMFEKFKHQPANPAMNQTGFMQMDKIALAYIKGDINDFLDAAKTEITDAEIAAHYEANKDSYRKPQLPSAEPETPANTEEKPAEETPAEESKPAGEEPAPMETPEAPAEEMKKEEAPAEPTKTEEEAKPADDAKPMEEPKQEPAAEEKPAEEPKTEEPKSEESKPEEAKAEDSSMTARDGGVQLVSFLQEEGEEPAKTEEAPAEEKPAETPAAETPATEAPMENEAPATDAPTEEAPVEYKPLAEVQDQIRTRLAQPKAQAKMQAALAEIRHELQGKYEDHRSQENADDTKSPYDSDNLEKLAKHLGLSFGAMPLSDYFEASQTAFAQDAIHFDFVFEPTGPRTLNRSLVAEAFESNNPMFQPRAFPGDSQTRRFSEPEVQYLYWKTDAKQGYAPNLEDVKDLVIKAWKEQEAAKLAKEHAEKLAEQIKTKEELAKAATEAGATVIVAENITYFNQLSGNQNLSLGTIPGVEDVAQTTMEALFSTPVGSTTVAPNSKDNVYYVALITGEGETNEQLRDNLMAAIQGALPASVSMYASQEENMVTRAILLDFFDPTRIDWKIDPTDLDSNS